jgi:peptidoglycan hydrolase CwlO-like protein
LEINKAEKAKMNYEKQIADLQEQIDMLKSQSGDLVN